MLECLRRTAPPAGSEASFYSSEPTQAGLASEGDEKSQGDDAEEAEDRSHLEYFPRRSGEHGDRRWARRGESAAKGKRRGPADPFGIHGEEQDCIDSAQRRTDQQFLPCEKRFFFGCHPALLFNCLSLVRLIGIQLRCRFREGFHKRNINCTKK